ncbi:MAG: M24 family metallopeptidase [Paraburkholderia sp.]
MNSNLKQAVGENFSVEAMRHARTMTWKVVDEVAQKIRPGMRESEANVLCKEILRESGMDRIWHPILIRFGENTLRTFKQPSQSDPQLAANDIYFVDLGVVWDRHEGDAGATFVVGGDPEMKACADAAKVIFAQVEQHWRATGAGGKALYDYASQQAEALGWTSKGIASAISRTPSIRQETSATMTNGPTRACGFWKYRSRIRRGRSARFTKICSANRLNGSPDDVAMACDGCS